MTLDTTRTTTIHWILSRLGFSEATEIQTEAMPVLASGESLLALSPTGSGKTLAFLIPLMERLDPSSSSIQLMVLAPTRELGAQIAQIASQVSSFLSEKSGRRLQVRTAFGGHKAEAQKLELLKKPALVVATPGRALDLIDQKALDLSQLKAMVLDEADLMVGMGFEEQIKNICDHLPKRIQAALFSATESEGQSRLQNRLVHRGQKIDVRKTFLPKEGALDVAIPKFTHQVALIPKDTNRLAALGDLLQQISEETETGIIFCQTRSSVQEVLEHLMGSGISAAGLSGELGQIERATMMRRFKSGGVKYLVATNLAARGIDVSDVSVVIHYELPSTQQEYLHRSGRSGRAGKSGRTISLCTAQSRIFLRDILAGTEISFEEIQFSSRQQLTEVKPVQEFVKIHVNRGKSSKLRPGDFLGALTQDLGLRKDDVGGIFIFDHFTHVEIVRQKASGVLSQLSGRKIKNLLVKATTAGALSAPRSRGF